MTPTPPKMPDPQRLEQATRARLAQLAAAPVEVRRLEGRFRAALRESQASPSRTRPWRHAWPMWSGLAAAVAMTAALIVLLPVSSSPAWAKPAELARLHEELVAGRMNATPMSDHSQAQQMLREQWSESPPLPDLPQTRLLSCCVQRLRGQPVAMVLVERDGQPVTVVLSRPLPRPDSLRNEAQDTPPVLQQYEDLNIVTVQNEQSRTTLVSRLSEAELLALARSAEP